MTELRIALLGSGYMGRTYAECISKHNTRAKLAAISGGTRAPGLAAEYGVDYVPTYDALLARSDVDAVLVATPHINHLDQVIQAAQAGKHILSEKPLATSVADCTRMIDACHQAGVGNPRNRYVLTGSEEGDYNVTLSMVSNTCNSAANPLLARPSTIPHPAGDLLQTTAVLPVGSAGYTQIAAWIARGCPTP